MGRFMNTAADSPICSFMCIRFGASRRFWLRWLPRTGLYVWQSQGNNEIEVLPVTVIVENLPLFRQFVCYQILSVRTCLAPEQKC